MGGSKDSARDSELALLKHIAKVDLLGCRVEEEWRGVLKSIGGYHTHGDCPK